MAEWLKAAVLKTVRGVTPSWVRILLPPPRPPWRWYLHKFRKTFATRELEKGADIHTVQTLLGRKNITTTARYLSTTTDKMRLAISRL
jgi:integrase